MAEAQVSLRKRRTWFEGDDDKGEGDKKPDDKDKGETDDSKEKVDPLDAWVKTLPPEAQAGAIAFITEFRQTRSEAKQRRLKLDEVERKQREADDQRQKDEQDKLAKQGEWEKVAAQRQQEIEALKPFKAEAASLRTTLQGMLDKRLESVPEHLRPLVKTMPLTDALNWLDENADKLKSGGAPDADGGKQGDRQKPKPDAATVRAGKKPRY